MIKGDNDTLGIEVVREGKVLRFIGHFTKEIKSEMTMYVADARTMFDSTGLTELKAKDGRVVGVISYEPQGTIFYFIANQGMDLISVDSNSLKKAVMKAVRGKSARGGKPDQRRVSSKKQSLFY